MNLGNLYQRGGHTEKAEKLLESAISNKPDFTEAVVSLARLFTSQSKYDAAIEVYEKYLQENHLIQIHTIF